MEERSNQTSKKRKMTIHTLTRVLIVEGLLVVVLLMCLVIPKLVNRHNIKGKEAQEIMAQKKEEPTIEAIPTISAEELARKKEEQVKKQMEEYLKEAQHLAAGYDYEEAIACIKKFPEDYTQYEELTAAITDFEKQKNACVLFGAYDSVTEVNHVFFHSLIYDTDKAFSSSDANGYNYYMTTVSEFKEMMKQMYDQGYVLVSIHDIVKPMTKEDGTVGFAEADLMLPPDKKPFVLSQDDVNYYKYMEGDGFASRMVIDAEGRPSTERVLDDGTTEIGEFDLVPILDAFIEEHPDFSYRGARGIIALTGYEGTLGYRTDPASSDSKTFEQDKETVRKVARLMRENGWEFACHSNGHRKMDECSQGFLESDTKSWLDNVGALVGETDIYIYPFGLDIQGGVKTYTNEKYQYLKQSGFHIFCGVEAKPWMQIRNDYFRMQRRPLDGQAMLMYPERLADLFDLSKVIDASRPPLK